MSNAEVGIAKIASYVKGFYSLFGNRSDRGLWFDELGQFCGVYESADGRDFENHVVGRPVQSQHGKTVLYAKIDGVGLVDILHQERNQIARIKNGKLVDMESGDQRRIKAVNTLVKSVAPPKLQIITEKLVHDLVEALQAGTHGTSFIVSFPNRAQSKGWKSTIEFQAKTLTRDFSRLEAPLATYIQLLNYAENEPRNLGHLFNFLVELANLDGGLWLQLSEDKGLVVKAAQQFIPLLKLKDKKGVRPFDLQMKRMLLGDDDVKEDALPNHPPDKFKDLIGIKTLFTALNGGLVIKEQEKDNYVKALSFLDHSGTKTHSLWGMSLTASESCLCVVLSSDGNVYVFHDGREFTGIQKPKSH